MVLYWGIEGKMWIHSTSPQPRAITHHRKKSSISVFKSSRVSSLSYVLAELNLFYFAKLFHRSAVVYYRLMEVSKRKIGNN